MGHAAPAGPDSQAGRAHPPPRFPAHQGPAARGLTACSCDIVPRRPVETQEWLQGSPLDVSGAADEVIVIKPAGSILRPGRVPGWSMPGSVQRVVGEHADEQASWLQHPGDLGSGFVVSDVHQDVIRDDPVETRFGKEWHARDRGMVELDVERLAMVMRERNLMEARRVSTPTTEAPCCARSRER